MSPREQTLILRLLGSRNEERLISGEQIVDEMDAIALGLGLGVVEINKNLPLILAFSPLNTALQDACKNTGFYPENDKLVSYRTDQLGHVKSLRDFIEADLKGAIIYRLPGEEKAILAGDKLTFLITQFDGSRREQVPSKPNWDCAFLIGPAQLRGSDPESQRDLRGLKILPVRLENLSSVGPSQAWTAVLPPVRRNQVATVNRDLALMHDFVRCTNQIDLLFTSARIFPYLVERGPWIDEDGWEHLELVEVDREHELPGWCLVKNRLYGMLQEEVSSAKDNCQKVLLTDHARLSVGQRPEPQEWWDVRLGRSNGPIRLKRKHNSNKPTSTPLRGFIRTYGLYGQFSLVERRKRAIDRLDDHKFLLRTLADPFCWDSKVYNEEQPFPQRLCSKQPIMIDIERVRPLYALQGPPGTGKTTLEAHHLRRVFDEHPEAQVLVTAQAHAAVDVLRSKVNEEAYSDVASRERPLAIRLGRRDDDQKDDDSVETVSFELLKETQEALRAEKSRTALQERWLQLIEQTLAGTGGKIEDSFLRNMQKLLKSGASITYCTTSAADLASLAESSEFDHTYDLVIVEESGRVHAFDLALPLQAGHRWLLLGDHKQLPGFQIRNFEQALKDLDSATTALERLGDRTYTDSEWIARWKELQPENREEFKAYALNRLRYFKWLHETLGGRDASRATTTEPKGTGAGMLTVQFRMHPDICKIISDAFYDGKLTTAPELLDANGDARLEDRHCLRLRDMPKERDLPDRAIAWIDLPWCRTNGNYKETGEEQKKLNFRNYPEIDAVQRFIGALEPSRAPKVPYSIAVLTPYRQQVVALQEELKNIAPPEFLELVSNLGARKPQRHAQWVHTVDSFQGNEADIIVTSLVRNNTLADPRKALGFMADPERLNVILSRPRQLLVLVGSWDFFLEQARYAKEGDDVWFLRTVLDTLHKYFQAGRAVRIPIEKLPPLKP
jgi:hypothetical protein